MSNLSIIIYTDGCTLNQARSDARKAGAAAIFIAKQGNKIVKERIMAWNIGNKTNNFAEMYAVYVALATLDVNKVDGYDIHIKSDSDYVVRTFNEWIDYYREHDWRTKQGKQIANGTLIRKIDKLIRSYNVKIEKVPAHNGLVYNELADKYAKDAASKDEEGLVTDISNTFKQ